MKETGSKIAVLVIILAMVFLAGVLFDATNEPLRVTKEGSIEHQTYEDVMRSKEFDMLGLEFEKFSSSEEVFAGPVSAIDFGTHPLAKNFESIIQNAYDLVGANFANKYSVVSWSCGIDCQNSVLINAETGEIIRYGIISSYGLSFSPTSRLLIINPTDYIEQKNDTWGVISTDYYVIDEENSLSLAAKVVNGENLIDGCISATTTARNFLTNEVDIFKTPCQVPFGWEIIIN